MTDTDLTPILERLDFLVERQRKQQELIDELMPIAREALATAIGQLDALDKQGTFASATDLARAAAALAKHAREFVDDADRVKPIGLFGAMRATHDPDVQTGLALVVEALRRIGRGVRAREPKPLDRGAKLGALLAPRRKRAQPLLPAPVVAAAPPEAIATNGAWTRDIAEAAARGEGLALAAEHWQLIDAARADFETTHASPNVRRLTQIANVSTQDLYRLFPKAPARTLAKIAGLPKPAGCL